MRIINLENKYESKIYLIDEEKLIYKLHCTCQDFQFRRIKKSGEFADVKYYYESCKHLKPIIDILEKQGYTIKKPQTEGPDKMTAEIKKIIVERSEWQCEIDGCIDIAERFHRVIRGNNFGKYTAENTKHICINHHKQIHSGEFNQTSINKKSGNFKIVV